MYTTWEYGQIFDSCTIPDGPLFLASLTFSCTSFVLVCYIHLSCDYLPHLCLGINYTSFSDVYYQFSLRYNWSFWYYFVLPLKEILFLSWRFIFLALFRSPSVQFCQFVAWRFIFLAMFRSPPVQSCQFVTWSFIFLAMFRSPPVQSCQFVAWSFTFLAMFRSPPMQSCQFVAWSFHRIAFLPILIFKVLLVYSLGLRYLWWY